MKFGIVSKQFLILEEILLRPLKSQGATVWIFGSRARGDFREFSDVDLLFELPKGGSLPDGFLYNIKTNLEDSNFIYKVDLVNIDDLAESYKEGVIRDRVQID